jgi:LacI family transcriptional regulator
VLLDRTFLGVNVGSVMVENEQGARKAVEHLLKHGYENILCIGYDRQFNSIRLRMDGYRKAMQEAGLRPDLSIANNTSSIGPRLLKRLRSPKPPSAVFSLNNVATIQVLQTLQRENLEIPKDLALVGFDDFEMAPLLRVPLTAVRQPSSEVGRTGAQLLLDRINSRRDLSRLIDEPQIVLPTELMIRESCGCQIVPRPGNRP